MSQLFTSNVDSRIIYLGDDIGPATTLELFQALLEFEKVSPDAPATLYINSLGGDAVQGLAQYDLIRNAPFKVTGIVVGECYSAASIVLQACNVRKMLPNARMMIHQGVLSIPKVHFNEAAVMMKENENVNRILHDVLCRHSGKTEKQLKSLLGFSTFFSPSEAIENGFCDKVHIGF
jgi:ATP-dependent Clp protease protease subunit